MSNGNLGNEVNPEIGPGRENANITNTVQVLPAKSRVIQPQIVFPAEIENATFRGSVIRYAELASASLASFTGCTILHAISNSDGTAWALSVVLGILSIVSLCVARKVKPSPDIDTNSA